MRFRILSLELIIGHWRQLAESPVTSDHYRSGFQLEISLQKSSDLFRREKLFNGTVKKNCCP